ncbi:MAG: FAD-dependent monooxygenase [Alphaproteobacteria bacterium]|nr:FAD-dependent monooxygenase [Alphaproteobacteria bacterium]
MKVGINGIGIGGPTLAWWLRQYGHEPVLFERAPQLRTEGFVVDFWGLGYAVAERMGLIDQLRAKGSEMKQLTFVDSDGHELAHLDTDQIRAQWDDRFITVSRGAICQTLFEACGDVRAEFGTHIVGVEEQPDGVQATLSDGRTETFDAIVGADGLHSAIREMVFGPEEQFEVFMDCYVAAWRASAYPHHDPERYVAHSIPNRWAARIERYDGVTIFLCIFRASLVDGDPAHGEVRDVLRRVYADVGWEVPEMLAHLDDGPVYFDRVSQIRMPTWSKGRVGLLGDAAACASLLAGEGTGLAMTEAYVLAGELHRAQGDVELAFRRYHDKLGGFLAHEQRGVSVVRSFFAPTTKAGVWARNLLTRASTLPGLTRLAAAQTVPSFELEDYTSG